MYRARKRLITGLTNGYAGWNPVFRHNFSDLRPIMVTGAVGGSAVPQTFEQGAAFADNMIDAVVSEGLLKNLDPNHPILMTTPEFALNLGSADSPVSADAYRGFAGRIQDRISKLTQQPGLGFILGGTAIDTGQSVTVDGRVLKVGENRAFVCFSSDDGIIEHTYEHIKATVSNADHWPPFYTVRRGENFHTNIPLGALGKMPEGDLNVLALSTCLDAYYSRVPIEAAIIVVTAAGIPGARGATLPLPGPNTKIIVADASFLPGEEDGNYDRTLESLNVYELKPKSKYFSKFREFATGLRYGRQLVSSSPESRVDNKTSRAKEIKRSSGSIYIGQKVILSSNITQRDIMNLHEKMQDQNLTIFDMSVASLSEDARPDHLRDREDGPGREGGLERERDPERHEFPNPEVPHTEVPHTEAPHDFSHVGRL